jgi:predicted 3-demethylubiquinone-9 3-methyltransferase (glyoxalase superfamily)
MSTQFQRISPFLWFSNQAEEAARFYTSIFPSSKITSTLRVTREVAQASGQPEGSVMTIGFQLDGQDFTAINGGPVFKFNEALSLVVNCKSQEEVDYYWDKLSEGGDPKAQQCGWLKDKYGVSWQIVPTELPALLADPAKGQRATGALMQMKKIDLNILHQAAA